ncbi:ISL3 family transposase [Streptomyces globisporus]|uniref:ISL3 family transposase n=1 Tax=Streptomyces globisporus TaxID=1908 RepID=UPI00099D1DD4|nr:ISL3 family transposase [Streptomyces globisporus]
MHQAGCAVPESPGAVGEVLLHLKELLFLSGQGAAGVPAEDDGEAIWIGVRSRPAGAECPGCGRRSNRVHGSYPCSPADLPSGGRRVVLRLRVRRFTCADASCQRQTFGERVPGLSRRHAQRTERPRRALVEVGLALAGRAETRRADVFGISVSGSTVLRLVEAMPDPQPSSPRAVGIDEYAMRKGSVYGTVLVDVETRRAVDLPPDREAATVAAWLAECPEVEVVCRDRAPFFAEGASTGAPTAVQIADRFPLWTQPRRSRRAMRIAPSVLPASAICPARLRGGHTVGSRGWHVTVADGAPVRRPNPREAARGPRRGGHP